MGHPNTQLQNFTLLIPAAGKGTRMQSDTPKQFIKIHGKTVLEHTLDIFHDMPECTRICLIISSGDADKARALQNTYKKLQITHGGNERKDSVYNALRSLNKVKDKEIILIHDAARPCLSKTYIYDILNVLKVSKAATLAAPVHSTLRKGDNNDNASDFVSRENLWEIQTPQAFGYGDILKAHENAKPDKNYTDDTQLVSEQGIAVKLVQGPKTNIKITTPEDLELAEKLLS